MCYRSSPVECNGCFPDISSGFFFLRDELFLENLGLAKAVISPSRFLAERVETWSAGALKVEVIENPRDSSLYETPETAIPQGEAAPAAPQIGYFGQINQFKGTEVLLDAAAILKHRDVPFRLRLFGANLNIQEESFRERIAAKIEELGDSVEFFGPYRNEAVIRLMSSCDAVVVPSIWWENSPVVIQEAIQAGVSVFGSRLGGIEEKLRDYPQARFFEPGSAIDLAEKLQAFCLDRGKPVGANTISIPLADPAAPMRDLAKLFEFMHPSGGVECRNSQCGTSKDCKRISAVWPSGSKTTRSTRRRPLIGCSRSSRALSRSTRSTISRKYPDIKQAVEGGEITGAAQHYVEHGFYEDRLPCDVVIDEERLSRPLPGHR